MCADNKEAGECSGRVHVTCSGLYTAGASVPVAVQLSARQGACVGATANATATAVVKCCVPGKGANGAGSVGGASSICWQHGAIVPTCASGAAPAAPYSFGFLNRGPLASGTLRMGLQGGCSAGTVVEAGEASATCVGAPGTVSRTMAFNVTVSAASTGVKLSFFYGCAAPANATAARSKCLAWKQVPVPSGPVSVLQPNMEVVGEHASYTWVATLPPAVSCRCSSAYWSVHAEADSYVVSDDTACSNNGGLRARGSRRGLLLA